MLHAVCARGRPTHLLLYICYVVDFASQTEESMQPCAGIEFEAVRTMALIDVWWATREVNLARLLGGLLGPSRTEFDTDLRRALTARHTAYDMTYRNAYTRLCECRRCVLSG